MWKNNDLFSARASLSPPTTHIQNAHAYRGTHKYVHAHRYIHCHTWTHTKTHAHTHIHTQIHTSINTYRRAQRHTNMHADRHMLHRHLWLSPISVPCHHQATLPHRRSCHNQVSKPQGTLPKCRALFRTPPSWLCPVPSDLTHTQGSRLSRQREQLLPQRSQGSVP